MMPGPVAYIRQKTRPSSASSASLGVKWPGGGGAGASPSRAKALLDLLWPDAILDVELRAPLPLDAENVARDSEGTLVLHGSIASYAAPPGVHAPRGPLRCRVDVYQSVSQYVPGCCAAL